MTIQNIKLDPRLKIMVSPVRIRVPPLSFCGDLQVNRGSNGGASIYLWGRLLQPYCNPPQEQLVLVLRRMGSTRPP